MKILPPLSPSGKRGLDFECENSTINLMSRAVAPTPVSSTFYLVGQMAPPSRTCAAEILLQVSTQSPVGKRRLMQALM